MAPAILFTAESQRRLREADRKWKLYAILRLLIVVLSFIGFSVFASAIPIWNDYFYWGNGPSKGDWEDGFPLGVLVIAFIWNMVALYLLLGRKKALKPYIPLTMDLLIWATLVPAITWSTGLGMFLDWTDQVEDYVDPELWHILVQIGRRELVGVVFACFVWALEVTLFIFYCIDTHKWRKSKKAGQPSMRALDHGEYAGQVDEDGRPFSQPPPKYEESHVEGRDIEMGATSPTAREFA